jgi:hypothetical protein
MEIDQAFLFEILGTFVAMFLYQIFIVFVVLVELLGELRNSFGFLITLKCQE